jgi:hypothetical protein
VLVRGGGGGGEKGGGRGREGRGGGEGRTCVRACVRACTRRLICPLLPNVNDEESCIHFRAMFRHRFTSPDECMVEWMSIQQNNTQYCANHRKMITNATSDYTSGNGPLAKTPTALRALKMTLQGLL